MQAGYYIQTHARAVQIIPVEVEQPVSALENVPLVSVEGWQPYQGLTSPAIDYRPSGTDKLPATLQRVGISS